MKIRMLIIIIVTLLFDGLHNYRELNNLIIVSSIGVDKLDDKYLISAQVIDTKKKDEEKVNIFKSEGNTIHEALRNMTGKSSKRLYLAHAQEMIISEEVAKENITECIDFLVRDNEVSMNILIVVAKNSKAIDILSTLSPTDNIPSNHLKDSILSSEEYIGNTYTSTLIKSLDNLIDKRKTLTLASSVVKGKEDISVNKNLDSQNVNSLKETLNENKVSVDNIAFFENNRLKGFLNYEDSIMYNLFNNNIKNSLFEIVEDNYKFSFEIVNPKCKIRANQNNIVDININSNVNITEKSEEVKVSTLEDINKLENEINLLIKKKVNNYLSNIVNLYKCDISNFSNLFYKNLNKEVNFKDLKYNINVNIKLRNEGGFVKKW